MLPCVAQGAIGIEIRRGDETMQKLLVPLNSEQTSLCVGAERALLCALDGNCKTPVGALARLTGKDELTLRGRIGAAGRHVACAPQPERTCRKDFEKIGSGTWCAAESAHAV